MPENIAESPYRKHGLDILATTLYFSNVKAVPLEPGLEQMFCQAAKHYEQKFGTDYPKREDEGMLQVSKNLNKVIDLWDFIYDIQSGERPILLKSGGFYITDTLKKIAEEKAIPYLTKEEKLLTERLGAEFAEVAKNYDAPKESGLIEIVEPIICYKQSICATRQMIRRNAARAEELKHSAENSPQNVQKEINARIEKECTLFYMGMQFPPELLEDIAEAAKKGAKFKIIESKEHGLFPEIEKMQRKSGI